MLSNLNDVLRDAQKKKYAVGLFNTTDTDMLEAAITAAEESRSPIIIGTAEVLLPYGDFKWIAASILSAARNASVPVVVHYDHGLTFERCMEALKMGFTSIMFDGSAGEYAKNVSDTAEMVRIAHSFGATVEGEIGHVGEAEMSENNEQELYTRPEEAQAFLNATGVDALAVSIGTAHGAYRNAPRLDFARLNEIRRQVDVPLVLHGGSGLADSDFRRSIDNGISKINIFTDLCLAGTQAMREAVAEGQSYLEIRRRKVEAIRQAVGCKLRLFGSDGVVGCGALQ